MQTAHEHPFGKMSCASSQKSRPRAPSFSSVKIASKYHQRSTADLV